jgi:glycosyltransferase involved in cell wall biosynthesis
MKIALFSCVNPLKSGISDYTEELLPHLSGHFDIDLFLEPGLTPASEEIHKYCKIKSFNDKQFRAGDYTEILYNFGNSFYPNEYIYQALLKYSGILILHDYVLIGFYAEKYYSDKNAAALITILKRYYAEEGEEIAQSIITRAPVQIWDTMKGIDFPLNEEIISHSKAIIVHSHFSKDRITEKFKTKIEIIPHHGHHQKAFDDNKTKYELGVKTDEILICSAGFINKNKRFNITVPAVRNLKNSKWKYLIIGKDNSGIISGLIKNGEKNFIIKSYLKLEDMERYISASDICINLRFPSMGESSGSLLRMMGYKKPVIVSDCASYSEFPDYSVVKINTDIYEREMLTTCLRELINNPKLREAIGFEAGKYVEEECNIKDCADKYASFINQINSSG